ncbi:HD domain-containing protein [Patescibacteria group bacterium]|nr:HD domain-containing protein [Patescibacteria group bacterium]
MQRTQVRDILTFLHRSKALESKERYSSSLRGGRNTVAEHSWRLGLMAYVIGSECNIQVDMSHALALALIHDLGEARSGDVDAYTQIQGGNQVLQAKEQEEESTMREMTGDISFGDRIYTLWKEYEAQETTEAKFIKALDKIEGFLHIAEGEVQMYIPKEFHADYANKAVDAFDEATHHFPELKDFLDAVKEDLKRQFERSGVKWIDEK